MRDKKIVFFGTSSFASEILRVLHEEQYHIAAVVSQPDRPVGRKHIITPTPTHALANEYGIPCVAPEKLKDSVEEVLQFEPDLILTCAYGQLVPNAILEYPKMGCLNIHPSLLPKYRGASPMHFPILNGESKTGVTLMEMVQKMDAGKIYAQKEVLIGPDETEEELEQKLLETSCQIVREALPLYFNGELEGIEQKEEEATFCHTIDREMEQVHFEKEAIVDLYNHIRAFISWPIAYGMVEGKRLKFYKVRMNTQEHAEPAGTILGFKNHAMEVSAIGGTLLVYEMQLEGKKRMDADAFANGNAALLVGKRFDG